MHKIAFLTTRFLDMSETFIYEPLKLFTQTEVAVYALQRRNESLFPWSPVYTWDDISEKERKKQQWQANFGKEEYLLNKMQAEKISLIHAHYGYMGVSALAYKKVLNVPLITSFYGLDVYQHTKSFLYRQQLKQLFNKGDLFLVCSNKMRKDLIALGAPPSQTKVVYGGAALGKFNYSFNACPVQGPITFLMCGRFVEKKGFVYGVQAFLRLAAHNEDVVLKIIGSGSEEAAIKKVLKNSPHAERVLFLGNKTHAEYIEEIKQCHVFVSPSVTAKNGDSEGLPTVLIEAAAIGRPLLATQHSGIPEIVHHGKNGYLAPERDVDALADHMHSIIEQEYLWQEFSKYGRELIEHQFNLDLQAKLLEQQYHQLLTI